MPEKRTLLYKTVLPILFILLNISILSACAGTSDIEDAPEQSSISFEDYLDQDTEEWFLTGKNEYSVQAMMVSGETSFHNDLEETDYAVTDDGVTVILKGSVGEMWASKLPKVISTYTKPDHTALCEEDFEKKDSWIEIITRPEPDAYYAMYVPLNIIVTVETAWGDVLHTNMLTAPHGDGDYLVCRAGDDGNPDLSDVWIVNGVVFPKYYDISHCPSQLPTH